MDAPRNAPRPLSTRQAALEARQTLRRAQAYDREGFLDHALRTALTHLEEYDERTRKEYVDGRNGKH